MLLPFIADDVYHVRLVSPMDGSTSDPGDDSGHEPEAFVFRDGTFATWGANEAQNQELMKLLKSVEVNSYREPETEWFNYYVDTEQ